jgi:hypothetical protein
MGWIIRRPSIPKSDLYRELLRLLNGGEIELLDHAQLRVQILRLERQTSRAPVATASIMRRARVTTFGTLWPG